MFAPLLQRGAAALVLCLLFSTVEDLMSGFSPGVLLAKARVSPAAACLHPTCRSPAVTSRVAWNQNRRVGDVSVAWLRMASGEPTAAVMSERVRKFLEGVPGNPIKAFEAADRAWSAVRSPSFTTPPKEPVVIQKPHQKLGGSPDYDVVVCGGTLGIFIAAALAVKGWKVAVVEQGKLVGRTQEWNISRKELKVLYELGVLTEAQMDQTIVTEYNPQRVGFKADGEQYNLATISGVLNLGVDPLTLIQLVKDKFLAAGGVLLEERGFQNVHVYDDAVQVRLAPKKAGAAARGAGGDAAFDDASGAAGADEVISARLMLDAMGNFSPVMRQARGYKKPDGICLVVGTCARGDWVDNSFGDLIYSFTPLNNYKQYFWEAFPSKDVHGSKQPSRTTYMFTYIDADPARGSLSEMFDDYLELLPKYSGAKGPQGQVPDVDTMQVSRALCGMFPCYTDSPLPAKFNRILQVGDTSGLQSPLSFGGFGSLLRHLTRLTDGLDDALKGNFLSKEDLDTMQPYLPSLSTMWLFQKAMSSKVGKTIRDPDIINKVLKSNFKTMEKLGKGVMMPFLQDVIQLQGLFATIAGMSLFDPLLVPPLLQWVGPLPVITWTGHFMNLGAYTALYKLAQMRGASAEEGMSERERFYYRRKVDAWKYGSGNDY